MDFVEEITKGKKIINNKKANLRGSGVPQCDSIFLPKKRLEKVKHKSWVASSKLIATQFMSYFFFSFFFWLGNSKNIASNGNYSSTAILKKHKQIGTSITG